MKNDNSGASAGGIGFVGLLTIVFITLKLLGKITWSWLWVLSPIWIMACLVVLTMVLIMITVYVKDRRRYKRWTK